MLDSFLREHLDDCRKLLNLFLLVKELLVVHLEDNCRHINRFNCFAELLSAFAHLSTQCRQARSLGELIRAFIKKGGRGVLGCGIAIQGGECKNDRLGWRMGSGNRGSGTSDQTITCPSTTIQGSATSHSSRFSNDTSASTNLSHSLIAGTLLTGAGRVHA